MNVAEVLIGCQGSGKSWTAMERAAELADKWDCPLVIHDVGSASILKQENPFHKADWKIYRTPEPPKNFGLFAPPDILVVNTGTAEDALAYADKVRRGGNVVVLVDEVTAAKKIMQSGIEDPWRTRIAQRRALKTAMLFCMQYPTMASRALSGMCTSIKCFRLENLDDIKALQVLRFAPEQIARVPHLKRGEYVERTQGFGT